MKPPTHGIRILPGINHESQLLAWVDSKLPFEIPKFKHMTVSPCDGKGVPLVLRDLTKDPVRVSSFDWSPFCVSLYFQVTS